MIKHLLFDEVKKDLNLNVHLDHRGYLCIPEVDGFLIKKYFKIASETMNSGFLQLDRFFTDGYIKVSKIKQFYAKHFSFTLYDYDPITAFLKSNNLDCDNYLKVNDHFDVILHKISDYLQESINNFSREAKIGDLLDIFGRFTLCKLDSVVIPDGTEYVLTSIMYANDVKKKHYSLYRKVLKNPFSFLYCQNIPINRYHKHNINYGIGDYKYNYCLDHYKKLINDNTNFLLTLPYKPADIIRDMMYILVEDGLMKHSNTDIDVDKWYYFANIDFENQLLSFEFPYHDVDNIDDLEFTISYKLNNDNRTATIPYECVVFKDKNKILELLK